MKITKAPKDYGISLEDWAKFRFTTANDPGAKVTWLLPPAHPIEYNKK